MIRSVPKSFLHWVASTTVGQRPYSVDRCGARAARYNGTRWESAELPEDNASLALSCQRWTRRVLRWLLCRGKPVSGADNKEPARLADRQSVVYFALSEHHSSTYHYEISRCPMINHCLFTARIQASRTAQALAESHISLFINRVASAQTSRKILGTITIILADLRKYFSHECL